MDVNRCLRKMILGLALAATCACVAFPLSASAGQGGSSRLDSARALATRWTSYVDAGNARAACLLQSVQSVNGKVCGELPTSSGPFYCPNIPPGPQPKRLSAAQQVKQVRLNDGSARALVVSQVRPITFRGHLGLVWEGGRWRVDYFQAGSTLLRPAGLVFEGSNPMAYRLSPPC